MAFNPEDFNTSGPRNISAATDWSYTHHRITVAASLVQGVYAMERDRRQSRTGLQALAPLWWESFHFQLEETLIDPSDSSIYGAIYKFKLPTDTFGQWHPPRCVVALRGTVIEPETMYQDFKLDPKILLKQKLTKSFRAEVTSKVVEILVDNINAGANTVWLAGHSLGSAIALTVGRDMAKIGIPLETYLLNPPFVSIPLEHIKLSRRERSGIRIAWSVAKAVLSKVVMDDEQRTQVENKFTQLSIWAPYLCVNEDDPICSEYIGYFKNRYRMARWGPRGARIAKAATKVSTRSLAKYALGSRTAEPFHLLPTANLVINKSGSQNLKEAHGVAQWWTQCFSCQPELHRY
nr:PREDICTED: GDSL esterase/lipase At4g10955-like [Daucus carota subsp. sativus]